uniref:Co-chaperonin GroES n=1 Tax=uncultured virus TaxID=340016 RepID=A0A221S3V4_9VIRU|nr:co-chaperonin GroES [uncultured virus]
MHKEEVDGYERLKTKESDKLPKPTGWRLVVLPFKMKEKTKGGLYLGQETIERQQIGSTCGLVLAMGPHCYDKEKFPEGPWCKKGDWVIFARYAGSRIQMNGDLSCCCERILHLSGFLIQHILQKLPNRLFYTKALSGNFSLS